MDTVHVSGTKYIEEHPKLALEVISHDSYRADVIRCNSRYGEWQAHIAFVSVTILQRVSILYCK